MHVLVPKRYREYEMVYVLSPTTTPGGATKISDLITESMQTHDGKVLKVDLWGIRSLAYRIKGNKQGIYYFVRFIGTQGLVEEMERRLRISEAVLRFLTVRLSEKLVDPASYSVDEEEAAFKPIDEIIARLADSEGDSPDKSDADSDDIPSEGALDKSVIRGMPDDEPDDDDDEPDDDDDEEKKD